MKKFLLFISMAILALNVSLAQTVLAPGDIAVLGIQADTPDDFQFVTFVDLEVGTEIRFTDSGVLQDGTFRGGEGGVKYTAPSAISAGTIVGYIDNTSDFIADNDAIIGTNGLALSTSGDQLIAFQGLSDAPSFLYALQINSTLWQDDASSSNDSSLPPGLIDGYTAVAAGAGPGAGDEWDNAVYDMRVTTGTVSDLLMFIGNPDFYLKVYGIGDYVTPTGSFTVLADVADTDAPVWEANYPAVVVYDITMDITSMMDEVGTVSYIVVPSGSDAPTSAEVIAGVDYGTVTVTLSGSFMGYNAETGTLVEGLVGGTDYDVYVVAADNESVANVQASPVLFAVSTTVTPDVLLSETFDADNGSFTAVSVIGDTKTWWWETYGGNGYMEMQAPTDEPSEDWLISSAFDLDAATDEMISFKSVNNFGDATSTLTVYLSNDFSDDYTPAGIAAATWDDVTSSFTLSPGGSYDMFESGELDISDGVGTGHIAFVYTYPGLDNSGMWEIDDVLVTGYLKPVSDATLMDLLVDGVSIADFSTETLSYTVELAAGVNLVPTVTYTTTVDIATAIVTPASDLAGDAAARTTTVTVTAADGITTLDYTILFNPVLEVATIADLRVATDLARTYTITGEVVLTSQDGYRNKKYFEDATGGIVVDDRLTGDFDPGVITTSYVLGDGITGLTGTLEDYYDLLQMHPTADPGTATSSANPVVPQVLTVSEFTTNFEDYESEFVKIEGVSFADAGSDFANGKNYAVNVGDDATVARTHFYDAVSGAIPNMADIQGVAVWDWGEAKVAFRMQSDLMPYSSDATLSDLMIDATTVTAFDAATLTYAVELGVGTTSVPTVTYTVTDAGASATVTDATDLFGTEAERTTSVEVTAEDGTIATYTIVFTVDNTSVNLNSVASISVYPVPAIDEIKVKGLGDTESFIIVNVLGSTVRSINVTGDEMSINISDLDAGIYMIRTTESVIRFMKK